MHYWSLKRLLVILHFMFSTVSCIASYKSTLEEDNIVSRPIIFIGCSSCGKTTTGNTFFQKYQNSILFEHDKVWISKGKEFLLEKHHSKFKQLYDIFKENVYILLSHSLESDLVSAVLKSVPEGFEMDHSILEDVKILQDLVMSNSKMIYNSATNSIIKQAALELSKGKIVIIDKFFKEEDFYIFKTIDPFYITIYCPFVNLFERVEKRNIEALESKDILNYRYPLEVMEQYVSLFRARQESDIHPTLETLKASQVKKILSAALEENTCYQPFYFDNLEHFTEKVLQKLGFNTKDIIEIVPRYPSNFFINSVLDLNNQLTKIMPAIMNKVEARID